MPRRNPLGHCEAGACRHHASGVVERTSSVVAAVNLAALVAREMEKMEGPAAKLTARLLGSITHRLYEMPTQLAAAEAEMGKIEEAQIRLADSRHEQNLAKARQKRLDVQAAASSSKVAGKRVRYSALK